MAHSCATLERVSNDRLDHVVESTKLGNARGSLWPLATAIVGRPCCFRGDWGRFLLLFPPPPFISSRVRVARHRDFHILVLAVAHPLPCEKTEKVLKLHDFAACIRFGIARGLLMHAWSNLSLIDLNLVNLAEVNLVPSSLDYLM